MDQHDFDRLIARLPTLASHADFVRALLRPCVRIRLTDQAPEGTQSRLAGIPTLPPGFDWPRHDASLYYCLGQINFAEIVNRPDALPETGVLVLLYADHDPTIDSDAGDIFWRDEGYMKAWYFEDPSALVPTMVPHGRGAQGLRITLSGELDLPRHSELCRDPPFDFAVLGNAIDDPDACIGRPSANPLLATDYLLGYPSHYSLGYDPTPGPEWVPLLTLHSHNKLEWCWQDGNKLMVFIERDRLAARDFSVLRCDAG